MLTCASVFSQPYFKEKRIMNVPSNLKYAKTDEWVKVEGNIATIGVSDYAQSQLSDVVYVEIIATQGGHITKNSTIFIPKNFNFYPITSSNRFPQRFKLGVTKHPQPLSYQF